MAYVSVDFCRDGTPVSVDDGVHLFDVVKVCLVVGVLDSRSTPRDVGQLTCWKRFTHTEKETFLKNK